MDGSSTKTSPQGYVTIHGHFYQPPRENPWIEQIEVEPSAAPFHDWNARITAECYRPNGVARIYDGQERILDIVNNYRYLSFNFGPTLISWLEAKAPDTYAKLLEADAQSLAALGNGNAIAQAYNHAILPLATARDRETQVIWGLKDFEHRFKRPAAALWLPETAVNYPTLATLVDQGMKFVLLSPYQAKRVRPLTRRRLDPGAGQRGHHPGLPLLFCPTAGAGQRRFIDVFFYDGGVAADLSFGDLLKDSHRLVARLAEGLSPDKKRPQLLHVATDGENYGHHKKFGELALAHALTQVLPQKGLQLTNYATFLELAPPTMEVELYLGPEGEGSSWSCAHGVGRWKENCGCSTGGQPTWNQRWRAPLRESFDFLNDKLAAIFESEGAKYFQDPWQARNAYIEVILDRDNGVLDEFFLPARDRQPEGQRPGRGLKTPGDGAPRPAHVHQLRLVLCGPGRDRVLAGDQVRRPGPAVGPAFHFRVPGAPFPENPGTGGEQQPQGGQRPHHLSEPDQARGGGLPQGGQPVGDFLAQGPGAPVSQPHLSLPGRARGPGGEDPGIASVRGRAFAG